MATVLFIKPHGKKFKVHLKAVNGTQLVCKAFKKLATRSACQRWIKEFLAKPTKKQETFIARHIIYNDDGTPKILDKNKTAVKVRYHRLEQRIHNKWVPVYTDPDIVRVNDLLERYQHRFPAYQFRVRPTAHRNTIITKDHYDTIKKRLDETFDHKDLVGICQNVEHTDYKRKQKKSYSVGFWNKK